MSFQILKISRDKQGFTINKFEKELKVNIKVYWER